MIIFPFPFLGGGIPKREMDRIEVVGSIYFLIVMAVAALATLLAWLDVKTPACFHMPWEKSCDVPMSGFASAVIAMWTLTIMTLLFLSVRRLLRAISQHNF